MQPQVGMRGVIKDIEIGKDYGPNELYFHPDMSKYISQPFVITAIDENWKDFFEINIDDGYWTWCPEMVTFIPLKILKTRNPR